MHGDTRHRRGTVGPSHDAADAAERRQDDGGVDLLAGPQNVDVGSAARPKRVADGDDGGTTHRYIDQRELASRVGGGQAEPAAHPGAGDTLA